MKKEEKLLDALGNVKSSYILECSQYVGNEQQERLLLKPRKPRWTHFPAIAAVMALFITATLVLLPRAKTGNQQGAAPLSSVISLGDGTQIRIVAEVGSSEGDFSPIERLSVYREDTLLQTIDESSLPNPGDGLYLGTGSGQPDYRDVNFDGYTDIGFPALGQDAENLTYHYFLWNPDDGKFDYGFSLFGGDALKLDKESRQLIEVVNEASGITWRRYYFENGTLLPLETAEAAEAAEPASGLPQFQVSYDETRFALTSGESGTFIAPLQGVGSYTPVCEIQIEFFPGQLPSAVVEQTKTGLERQGIDPMPQSKNWDRTILYARYGTQWDSKAEDIHFFSAGVRGTYRLTSRYFLEAAEGYGTTFAEICSHFTCPLSESANPQAECVAISFADGFFSGDWSDMEPYLYDPNGEISHEDVYTGSAADIEMVELRGLELLDEHISKDGTGTLSLVFRENGEDSYTYLSMDMVKNGSEYKISFFGLEK